MTKPTVAFICVHNSCRSQMAEAIAKLLASDVFTAYSAGTSLKAAINSDAITTIERLYGVNMTKTQSPKLLTALPAIDVVITMGCNVECPTLPCKMREDWGLTDPTGKDEEAFDTIAKTIERKVIDLKNRLKIVL